VYLPWKKINTNKEEFVGLIGTKMKERRKIPKYFIYTTKEKKHQEHNILYIINYIYILLQKKVVKQFTWN